jgi:hypothetical protein
VDEDPRENIFEAISLEILIVAFIFNLLSVVASIFLQVFGPYAALKAKPHELQGVVREIRMKRRLIIRLFLVGLVCFELSTLALIWARWMHVYAGFATLIVLAGDFYLHKIYHGISRSFDVPSLVPDGVTRCCSAICKRPVNIPGNEPSDIIMFPINYETLEDGDGSRKQQAQSGSLCTQCKNTIDAQAKFCNTCGSLAPHR